MQMYKVGLHKSQCFTCNNAVAFLFWWVCVTGWHFSGEPSQAATGQDAAAETQNAAKRRSAAKLSVSTPEVAAISDDRPNLNIGMDLWSNSPVKAETSGQGEINVTASSQRDVALSQMVCMGNIQL